VVTIEEKKKAAADEYIPVDFEAYSIPDKEILTNIPADS
jgi:hypothetical protein